MRTFGIILIVIGSLIVWAGTEVLDTDEDWYPEEFGYSAELDLDKTTELYLFACDFVQGQFGDFAESECPTLPIVIFREMKIHGFYQPGSRVVWLNDGFTHQNSLSIFGEGISIHEMVHYVLYQYELMTEEVEFCREENIAWTAANNWVLALGRDEDENPQWWDWYAPCDSATGDPVKTTRTKLREILT